MTNHSKDEYAARVFEFMQNGKYGETYTIDRICATDNQPRFIALAKQYMNETDWQGGWEFSSDYTKLRRVDINFEKKKDIKKLKQYEK